MAGLCYVFHVVLGVDIGDNDGGVVVMVKVRLFIYHFVGVIVIIVAGGVFVVCVVVVVVLMMFLGSCCLPKGSAVSLWLLPFLLLLPVVCFPFCFICCCHWKRNMLRDEFKHYKMSSEQT